MSEPDTSDIQILGGVLAGGLSRRMDGNDKALAELSGRPLLHHVIDRLNAQTSSIIVNANNQAKIYDEIGLPIVPDHVKGFAGPLAGVHAMMRYTKVNHPEATHLATVAVDTPLFPENFISSCVNTLSEQPDPQDTIVLARSNGNRHPVFGIWPINQFDDLEEFLTKGNTLKVMAFVQRHPHCYADFKEFVVQDQTIDPFFNINRSEELETANWILSNIQLKTGGDKIDQ